MNSWMWLLALAMAGCGVTRPAPTETAGDTGTASPTDGFVVRTVLVDGYLVENGSVTVRATVEHPDGAVAVREGSLQTPLGAAYAAFTRQSDDTWALDLTWSTVNATEPITFTGGGDSRAMVAVFEDDGGDVARFDVSVGLSCPADACSGVCVSLADDLDHCGVCERACLACEAGVCARFTGCIDLLGIGDDTLNDVCTAEGGSPMVLNLRDTPLKEDRVTAMDLFDDTACASAVSGWVESDEAFDLPLFSTWADNWGSMRAVCAVP